MGRLELIEQMSPDSFYEYGFTHCGVPVAHSYSEILLVEQILFKYDIKVVVELGVWFSGLSMLFLNVCDRFLGYDYVDMRYPKCIKLFIDNEHTFKLDNVLTSDRVSSEIRSFIKDEPFLLYVDNGNKKEELNRYLPLLRNGDICIAHDFNLEWTLSDVQKTLDENNLDVVFMDIVKKLNSKQCIFAKK